MRIILTAGTCFKPPSNKMFQLQQKRKRTRSTSIDAVYVKRQKLDPGFSKTKACKEGQIKVSHSVWSRIACRWDQGLYKDASSRALGRV